MFDVGLLESITQKILLDSCHKDYSYSAASNGDFTYEDRLLLLSDSLGSFNPVAFEIYSESGSLSLAELLKARGLVSPYTVSFKVELESGTGVLRFVNVKFEGSEAAS